MSNRSQVNYQERYPFKGMTRCESQVYSCHFGTCEWAIFTVCDATGEFTIQSDWGNFSNRWNIDHLGGGVTLTEFIRTTGIDYLSNKLLAEGRTQHQVVDRDATLKSIRAEIIECRRNRDLIKEQARDHWDHALGFVAQLSECHTGMSHEYMDDLATFLSEPWEFIMYRDSRSVEILEGLLLPTFKRLLEQTSMGSAHESLGLV